MGGLEKLEWIEKMAGMDRKNGWNGLEGLK
jgi:hypothetical protein